MVRKIKVIKLYWGGYFLYLPIFSIITLSFIMYMVFMYKYHNVSVHLSIDDVEICMNDIIKNHSKYNSIFEQSFFHDLKSLHDEYGAKFTLYTYNTFSSNRDIDIFPLKYKKELSENSDWLKFGFHACAADCTIEETSDFMLFSKCYNNVTSNIERFAGKQSVSTILRLHYWFATKQEIQFLSSQGINYLLSCDKEDRQNYSLNSEQRHILHEKGSYSTSYMKFLRTELRVEDAECALFDLLIHNENDTLVVFTHEWALQNKKNVLKLNRVVGLLNACGCNYIN